MDTHSTMASLMMTSRLEKWCWLFLHHQQTPFSYLTTSFATVCFVLAGCGVCIPLLLVPKRGSVSNLEKVVSLLMVKANKKIWAQKGIREYRVSEADWLLCQGNEACTCQTITAHQKVTVVRYTSENGLSRIFHLLILKYHCVHAASANLKM